MSCKQKHFGSLSKPHIKRSKFNVNFCIDLVELCGKILQVEPAVLVSETFTFQLPKRQWKEKLTSVFKAEFSALVTSRGSVDQ